MATIRKRTNKDGTDSWLVQIRIKGAKPLHRSFSDHIQAMTFAAQEEARLHKELMQKSDPKKFFNERLKDVMQLWCAQHPENESTRFRMNTAMRFVGDVLIGHIDDDYTLEFIDKVQRAKSMHNRPYADGTIATLMTAMTIAYKWRAKQYKIKVKDAVFPRSLLPDGWDVERDRRLEKFEELALRKTIAMSNQRHYRRLLLNFALETGARQGEFHLALWQHIDLENRNWHIPKQNTKTRKARDVGLSKKAIRTLKMLKLIAKPGATRIFDLHGSKDALSNSFRRLTKKAGIVDFHFHDLRHEAISRMVLYKPKMSMYEIMRTVGHSSTQMLDRYANLRGNEIASKMD